MPKDPRLIALVRRLPAKILKEFCKKYSKDYGLKVYARRSELVSQILAKVPEEVLIKELYMKYEQAGNTTVHLFKLEGINVKKITDLISPRTELSEVPIIVDMMWINNTKLMIRFEYVEPILVVNEEYQLEVRNKLQVAFAIMHVLDNFVEVRTRSRNTALWIIRMLAKHMNSSYEPLRFSRDQIGSWVDWAKTLRNARFKPIRSALSTVSLTAREEYDLREIEEFEEWWKKEERVGGIYIKAEIPTGEELGFGINAEYGKIMFKTFASEEEIQYVIKKAKQILGFS